MTLKNKSKLFLVILPVIFLTLHYIVYLGNYQSPFGGNQAYPDWFILVSNTEEPLTLEKVVLFETLYPNYFDPFQNIEYRYTEKNSDKVIIVEQGAMFSNRMNIIKGNPGDYHNPNVDGDFYKGFGSRSYPNGLFFLVQYLIIGIFIFLVGKQISKWK